MFSVAIIRDWRKQCGDDKLGPLDVRVTVDRKSYYISTGMKVLGKLWAGAVGARPDADALNNRLGIIVRRVNEKVNEYIEARQPIDVSAVREFVYSGTKVDGKQDRMLTWIESQIDALQVSDGTRRHYWLLVERRK